MTEYAYIHIPFCKTRCKYCSFVSFTKLEMLEKYLLTLKKDIKKYYKDETLKTLYFGGGTPSILKPSDFAEIIELFNIDKNTEITSELNPEHINQKYLEQLKTAGINRLSFGCQTFNNDILSYIGRRHRTEDLINSVNYAKQAEFENISIDLIYGLPFQTVKMFEEDLKKAVNLGIQHISLYGLKIDSDCYFYKHMPKNLPDEDIQADMYLKAIEILTKNNFEHYEVSNFAKNGFESKHNLNYWNNNTYYGFGAGAHGYEKNTRYYNSSSLEEYITENIKTEKILTKQEKLEEEIFLGLRKMEGINISKINQKFGIDFCKKYCDILEKYSDYFEKTPNGYKFNIDGILISNTILSDFLE